MTHCHTVTLSRHTVTPLTTSAAPEGDLGVPRPFGTAAKKVKKNKPVFCNPATSVMLKGTLDCSQLETLPPDFC